MLSNEDYLAGIGMSVSHENYIHCLAIMERHGDHRWWLSDEATIRAYSQTKELTRSGMLLLPSTPSYQLDLFALLKRVVLSEEIASPTVLFEQVEQAWRDLQAGNEGAHATSDLPRDPLSHASRIAPTPSETQPHPQEGFTNDHGAAPPSQEARRRLPRRREGGRALSEPREPNGGAQRWEHHPFFARPLSPERKPEPEPSTGPLQWTGAQASEAQMLLGALARMETWDGETHPLHEMLVPLMFPEEHAFLQEHGCVLHETAEGLQIFFPPGSTRTQLYPHTSEERFRLRLPDGSELRESHPRWQGSAGPILFFPRAEEEISEQPVPQPEKGQSSSDAVVEKS